MIEKKKSVLMKRCLCVIICSMICVCECGVTDAGNGSASSKIRLNQVGFYPVSSKIFMIADSPSTTFELRKKDPSADTGYVVVYAGTIEQKGLWDKSGERIGIGDFSSFTKEGIYTLAVAGISETEAVTISSSLYSNALRTTMRSYFFQRASCAIDESYAGPAWYREGGHWDTVLAFDPYTLRGREGSINVSKGWYDAGDYGKYVVNGGITVGTLLALYELYPSVIGDDSDIIESGNGKSDLLDEVKWELDWFASMQDTDGGVFFKVAGNSWSGFVQPVDDKVVRYVIGKSTASTLNFAACCAQAGRVYRSYDRSFADSCIIRADNAWKWAVANPSIGAPDNTRGSGPYGDMEYKDEFLWAAAELYISTGKSEYRDYIKKNLASVSLHGAAWWQDVANLAYYSLATIANGLDAATISGIKSAVVQKADETIFTMKTSMSRYPLVAFEWGSAGNVANCGVMFFYAYRFTGKDEYLKYAAETLDFVLGRNSVGRTFITGIGVRPPLNPHHRPSGSDRWDDPVPGLVVGGPNQNMEDTVGGMRYSDTHPAKCYLDERGSYSSNEPAINQNAPVVFLMGVLESEL